MMELTGFQVWFRQFDWCLVNETALACLGNGLYLDTAFIKYNNCRHEVLLLSADGSVAESTVAIILIQFGRTRVRFPIRAVFLVLCFIKCIAFAFLMVENHTSCSE